MQRASVAYAAVTGRSLFINSYSPRKMRPCAGGLALAGWGRPSAPFFLGGALFYIMGTFLVTGLGNAPLNDQLAAVSASDPSARDV